MCVTSTDVASPVSAERMAALPPAFRALLQSVTDDHNRRMAECEMRFAVYERRIAELEGELRAVRKTSQNSSLPPSVEHPHAKTSGSGAAGDGGDATISKQKPRKRGGQQGHPKHERTLLPLEQCDDVVPLKPKRCRGCGEKLRGDDPDPWRHQVWEWPQPQPRVTESQRHRLTCSGCGVTTCAELPAGVPEHTSGPRLLAVTAVLRGLSSIKNTVSPVAIAHRAGSPHTVRRAVLSWLGRPATAASDRRAELL